MSETEDAKKSTEGVPAKARRKVDLDSVRSKVASAVWLVAVLAALVLAVSALCVALKMNPDNAIINAVHELASKLDFGTFKEFPGSEVAESSAAIKFALVNLGIAAVIWLVLGKILDKLIRP